jgi:lactoylglutathione lyase
MLRVYDIDKSLEFYQTVLGLKLIKTRDFKEAKLYYMAEKDEDPKLALCYNYEHYEKYTRGTYFGYVGFEVASIDDFTKKLESLGLEYERLPFMTEHGYRLAFIKDPDGHMIELVEPVVEKKSK